MNKLYSVHDHWTDINKKNDVDIESIDGVITGIKVNGEDYGGGGESEMFKIAKVTLVNNHSKGNSLNGGIEHSNTGYGFLVLASDIYEIQTNVGIRANSVAEYQAILMLEEGETPTYSAYYVIDGEGTPTVTGEATLHNEDNLLCVVVTGDCTITIS